MANTIKLKRGTSTPSTSDISSGEVAIDTSAQKLYINDSGTVKEIGGGGAGTGQQFVNLETSNSPSNTGVNTFAGYLAGNAFTTADHTTLFGYQAGSKITGSGNNCFFGSNAGKETTGTDNCGFGQAALETNTSGASNVAVGRQALYANESGGSNVAIGKEAGKLVTGSEGVFIGASCGTTLTSGSANTFVGSFSGQAVCGSHNVAVGSDAFRYGTGGTNTCVGRQAGFISNFSGSNNLLLGYQADPTSASTSNEITLGNTSITKFRIPGLNFSIKDSTATDNYVLTVDANGDAGWEAVPSSSDNTKLPLAGGTLTGNVIHNDNVKALFGTGSDLQIYHDGTNSHLNNSTGYLVVGTDSYALKDQSLNEFYIKALKDGAVSLYYNNSEKLATTSYGVFVTGTFRADVIDMQDNKKSNWGNDDDLEIYHDGSHSNIINTTGNLYINASSSDTAIVCKPNGAVELYYDHSKKLESTSDGVRLPDGQNLTLGDGGDVKLKHQSTHFEVNNTSGNTYFQSNGAFYLRCKNSGSTESMLIGNVGASVDLYHDNVKSFETTSTGAKVNGSKLEVINTAGAGDAQLYLEAGEVGTAYIQFIADNGDDNTDKSRILQADGANLKIQNYDSGSWATKLETTSGGITVTGTGYVSGGWRPLTDNAVSLGSASYRWYDLNISNDINISDNGKVILGDGDDLQIYHDGSHTRLNNATGNFNVQTGAFVVTNVANTENLIIATQNNDVEIYYDNSKKLETGSGGIIVHGSYYTNDSNKIYLGSDNDLQIYHDGGNSFLQNTGGNLYIRNNTSGTPVFYLQVGDSNENALTATFNGAVELYYDGTRKAYTNSGGFALDSHLIMGDSDIIKLGNGADLQLYHDGSNSYIDNNTGTLNLLAAADISMWANNTEQTIKGIANGAVELYFDGSQKIKTTSVGVQCAANTDIRFENGSWTGEATKIQHHSNWLYVQGGSNGTIFRHTNGTNRWIINSNGDFYPNDNNTYDIGTSSYRVKNIYVNDLQLSNESKKDTGGNDVDGTWGDWTLQEGEEDIFMINNRTGKKYKMGLQEVV
jgi:hypothetical protein